MHEQPRSGRLATFALDHGGLLALVAVGLYAVLAPSHIVDGDNAEFSTLSVTGGAAHPSGYPLYVLYLRALSWMPVHGPAHAAAIATALLAGAALLVTHAACRAWGARPLAATIATALLAAAPAFMRIGMRAEVFALNTVAVAAVLWLSSVGGPLRGRWRALALGLVAGLGMSNHLTCTLLAPVGLLGVVRASREDRAALAPALALVGLVVGLLPYAYLLAAPDTPLSWGTARTLDDLVGFVTRRDYGGAGAFAASGTPVPVGAQLAALAAMLGRSWLWGPLVLALVTLGVMIVRPGATPTAESRWAWGALALSWVVAGPVLVTRFNIDPVGIGLYVCERFYLLPMHLLAIPLAVGLTALGSRLTSARISERTACGFVATLGLLAAAGSSLPRLARVHTSTVETYARNVLTSMPPDAVVFAAQDYEYASLLYLQAAVGVRRDVVVIAWDFTSKPWYVERLRRRGVIVPAGASAVSVVEGLLAQGRPVFVERTRDPVTIAVAAVLPTYLHGTSLRVLSRGSPRPSLDAIIAENQRVFDGYAIGDARPGRDDEYATEIHRRYALTWELLGRQLARAGRAADAERAAARAGSLSPR